MARSDGSSSGGGGILGTIAAIATLIVTRSPQAAAWAYQIGNVVGTILSPPSGPDVIEPSIQDAQVMTSSNIVDIPTFSGTVGIYGNIIAAKDNQLQEVITVSVKKKKVLGFTVAKQKITTKTYYLNCAVGLALMDEGDDCQLLKIWIGDKLVLNRTTDDTGTIVSSGDFEEYIRFYKGTDDQEIDPDVALWMGADKASAWPALAYLVITDLDMSPWNDSVERAQIKVELSSGNTIASDLEYLSQTPAPLHPQYVSNWNINHVDSDGAHAWKWGSTIAEEEGADTTWANYSPYDFDKLHYVAVPGGGGYLKEKLTDIIPREYLRNPSAAAVAEQKGLRHTAKGKADINAAVFVTAFAKTMGGGGDGGSYPHPSIDIFSTWAYQALTPTPQTPILFDTFGEALAYARANIPYDYYFDEPATHQVQIYDGSGVPVGINYTSGLDGYAHFSVYWVESGGQPPYVPPPTAYNDLFSDTPWIVTYSVTLIMPGLVKEFTIGASKLFSGPTSSYVIHDGHFYWGATIDGGAVVYKLNIEGNVVDTTAIPWVSNPVTLVRIGVVDNQFVMLSRIGSQPILRIFDGMTLGDITTYTDYDSSDIDAAFGFTGEDFINNASMDFNKFIYFRSPNVYTKESFTDAEELLGNPDGDLISGEDAPEFFNFWLKGNLLVVSTFGGSMPETGVQFFTVGLIGEPGTAQLADIIRKYCRKAGVEDADLNTDLVVQEVRGHRVASRGSARNILEQLRGLWPFDIVPSGYELKIVPRGQSSVATISYEDLGPDVQLVQDREMSTQIPWELTLRCLDRDLEYEVNEQKSTRPIDSSTTHIIQAPVVFTPNECAQKVAVLHSIFLNERQTFAGIVLPPNLRQLEPSDVVTIVMPDATYEIHLGNLKTLPNGSRETEGKPNAITLYTSTAVGETRTPPPQTIPVAGGTTTLLLDIPVITNEDAPGFSAVMASQYDNWAGGALWKKAGNLWEQVQAFGGNCTIGTCSTKLNAHGGHLIDLGSTLTVTIQSGAIADVTDAQFYNEEFLVAYGAPGRWEIMCCKNVTALGGNVFTVDTFLRGRRGTEWATGLHQANDWLVSLNDADNEFIELIEAEVGSTLIYRGASTGKDIGSEFDISLDYQGENLTPLSPVQASGYRDSSDNFFGQFIPRSRLSNNLSVIGNIYDGMPMGEETELYEIDVVGSDPPRTITVTTPEFEYPAADQVTDFGSEQPSIDFEIYQISAVVGRGRVGAFTL